MKRLLVFLLVLVLGLSAVTALAEEEAKEATVAQLNDMVREFLDNYDYTYTYMTITTRLNLNWMVF